MPGDILFKAKGLNNTAVLIGSIPSNTTVTASCHIIRVVDKNFLPEYVCSWLNSAAAKIIFKRSWSSNGSYNCKRQQSNT